MNRLNKKKFEFVVISTLTLTQTTVKSNLLSTV